MTSGIDRLPPPYPNQALARSKETSEVSPQKIYREKAAEVHRIELKRAGANQSGDAATASSDSGHKSSGAGTGNQGGKSKYNVIV